MIQEERSIFLGGNIMGHGKKKRSSYERAYNSE